MGCSALCLWPGVCKHRLCSRLQPSSGAHCGAGSSQMLWSRGALSVVQFWHGLSELFVGGRRVHHRVSCSIPGLSTHCMPVALLSAPSYGVQKWLQVLPNISWGSGSLQLRTSAGENHPTPKEHRVANGHFCAHLPNFRASVLYF